MRARIDVWIIKGALIIALLYLGVVQAYPFLWALGVSLQNRFIGRGGTWVGLSNYVELLKTPLFWNTIRFTLTYVFLSVLFKLLLGFIMAMALNQPLRGRSVFRALLFLPWALPTITSTLTWRWMLGDVGGIVNYALMSLGLVSRPIAWLGDPIWARFSVILINVWRGTPFFGISILAALQSIDPQLYEAAMIDGAGAWRRFISITIPSVLPVVALVTLVSTIWTLGDFTIIWVLTRGGPGTATHVFSTLSYIIAFQNLALSRGVAISMSVVPLSLLLMFFAMRLILGEGESR